MADSMIIRNEVKGIIQKVDTALFPKLKRHINFQSGSDFQAMTKLMLANNAATAELRSKYPLVFLQQPFAQRMGGDYYATVKFSKLAIADLSNATDDVDKRYDQRFIPTLYPIYNEILKQICRWPTIVIENPDFIPHVAMDIPGDAPPANAANKTRFNDWVDSIIITDLDLTFQLNHNC